jgi:hypothetical protein
MKAPVLKMFAMLYGAVYFTAFYMEMATFRYYPETSRFFLQNQADMGPAILWYGWMFFALVVTLVVSILTPRKLVEKIPNDAIWIVNVGVLLVIAVIERQWFT